MLADYRRLCTPLLSAGVLEVHARPGRWGCLAETPTGRQVHGSAVVFWRFDDGMIALLQTDRCPHLHMTRREGRSAESPVAKGPGGDAVSGF